MLEHHEDDYTQSFGVVMRKLFSKVKSGWVWVKSRLSHKLGHLKLNYLLDVLSKHGMALVVIIVGWEIIEDVLFPAIFALLGTYVHPVFFTGIPVAWIVCLHWLMVPVLWGLWIKIKKTDEKIDHDCGGCSDSEDENS